MKVKLITDIATEPVTLSEVKNHLRIDSNSFADNVTTYQSIVPSLHTVGTLEGTGIDVLANVCKVLVL